MDYVERMQEKIAKVADSNAMEAYLVGKYTYGEKSDPRLLKIAPIGLRSAVLLELDFHWRQMRIYQHRNAELTHKYRGTAVTADWVTRFIEANKETAQRLVAAQGVAQSNATAQRAEATRTNRLTGQDLKAQRLLVTCRCRGEVENCLRCQGSGQYWTDGFGNIT